MKRFIPRVPLSIAPLLLLLVSLPALGASTGVRDEAHFFSSGAVSQADQIIHQINARHHRDVLIETVPNVPQDMAQEEQSQGRDAFFKQWADQRASQEGVSGVYVLICKDPPHLQVAVGNATAQRLFTYSNRDELSRRMLASFKAKDFDQGLLDGVRFIQQQMDAHVPSSGGGVTQYNNSGSAAPVGPYGSSSGQSNPPRGDMGWGFGSIACVIVAVILGIILIRGVMGRSGGSYGAPGGNYPPGGGGAYPPPGGYAPPGYGGGYAGGGGSGFGRGFLGGLLGGALGGYAAERWTGQNQPQGGGFVPPAAGGGGGGDYNPGPDTSFSSSGGDFGSSDPGGGAGADLGGGDFGGGGGGGDFGGGGGGDSGGGGGGDF